MVNQIYPPELQLNKANISDTEAPFLDLHLSVANGFVSSKIYDKRNDFDFDIVNFPFLDGDVPRRASYGVYISQLIRFARVCNHVTDFNARNKCLTAKLLQQGYRYHKLRKTFSKFYRRHYELISKYNVGLKTLLSEGLSEPEFYGDLVYKFKKVIGIVRHKINLTWNCGIKFFSLQILVGKTLPLRILDDDSLSSLSILRNSRWRPRCQKIMKIQILLYNVSLKMNKNAMFPHSFSRYYYI